MSSNLLNIAVFISGVGSNFEKIYEACVNGNIPNGRVVVVIADRICGGVYTAMRLNIPTVILERKDKIAWNRAILNTLKNYKVNLSCLAGFMKIIGPEVVDAFPNQIINLHPGKLPLLAGKDPQKKALELKLHFTGNTVHIVTNIVDGGPILATDTVSVDTEDTIESLSLKLKKKGYSTYINAIHAWLRYFYNK